MGTTRIMTLAMMVVLLVSSLAVPALAQDGLPEDCEVYPIGECLEEVDEVPPTNGETEGETITTPGEQPEVQDVVLTRDRVTPTADTTREGPRVLGTTLAYTGSSTLLLIVAGLALALVGGGALFYTRRRSSANV